MTISAPEGKDAGNYAKAYVGTYGNKGATTGRKDVTFTLGQKTEVMLGHNQTIVIPGLPEGIAYTVKEVNTDNNYTVKVDGQTTDTANGPMSSTAVTRVFTNDNTKEIDTGVSLDSLPYVIVLLLVVLGAAVLASKKRFNH